MPPEPHEVIQGSKRFHPDRLTGVMPSEVRARSDGDELWTAFRRHVGIGWTGQRVRDFIAGWDLRAALDAPDGITADCARGDHSRCPADEDAPCFCACHDDVIERLRAAEDNLAFMGERNAKCRAEVERLRHDWQVQVGVLDDEVERLEIEVERLRQFAEWCSRIEGWRDEQVVSYARRVLDEKATDA